MSDLFWTLLHIAGDIVIGLVVLIFALVGAILALVGVWLVIDTRRQRAKARERDRENAALHERIHTYLRDAKKEGSNEQT